jgi:hypothetical protein
MLNKIKYLKSLGKFSITRKGILVTLSLRIGSYSKTNTYKYGIKDAIDSFYTSITEAELILIGELNATE